MTEASGVAWLFPGQGSQAVGMGRDLAAALPAVSALYAQADSILGVSLSSLCFDGPEEALTQTINAQPALLTTSVALLLALGAPAQPVRQPAARLPAELVELASSDPAAALRVIVYKAGAGEEPERLVKALGGTVFNELKLINAFSARLEARQLVHLSRQDSVSWITLDAPVRATDINSQGSQVSLRAEFDRADYAADLASWSAEWS